nr:probable disease resistance protein At5g66900 [Ipomoea trifida]
MAVELVGGAALSLAFDKFSSALVSNSRKIAEFSSHVDTLKSTISEIKPIVEDIEELDRLTQARRYETDMLIKRLDDCEALIDKCSKLKPHDLRSLWKKFRYSRKMEKLEESLSRFFKYSVPMMNLRDNKQIMAKMNVVDDKIDTLLRHRQNSESSSGGATAIVTPSAFSGWSDAPAVLDVVVGLDVPLQELKKMVLKVEDDEREPVLVISAPGGCGKTTLAKMLCHDLEITAKYKHISFVTVSRTPNLRNIVQKIFNKLNNGLVPHFQSNEDAINQLQHLLHRHLVSDLKLLVLDDVWPEIPESLSVLQKLIFSIPKYKVLVTTRFECPRFKYTYKLQLLPDNDAMVLFCNYAFEGGKCSVQSNLVDKVVKSCGGFPLALKVVGRSLYGQHKCNWINIFKKQSKGQILFTSDRDLLDCLQPSIDALDENSKECYKDLGVFLEDQRIPAAVLLDIWVELYNLDEDGFETYDILFKLAARNLVDLAFRRKDDPATVGFSNSVDYVRQHDVLRELAIHQSANEAIENRRRLNIGDDLSVQQLKQTRLLLQAHMLSISTDEALFPSVHDLQFPNLEVLLLNIQTSSYTLPKFLEKSSHLKVLVITNSGFFPIMFSNSTLLGHLHNLKRIRLERISFSSICRSTFKLGNLQKMSLVMCEIGDAFQDCVVRMPNLLEINIEYCDDLVVLPVAICDLVHLKRLIIRYCQRLVDIPEELGNLENLEVLMLHSCSSLTRLPDSIERLCKLSFLDIFDCVDLDRIPLTIGKLCSLKTIFMGGHQGLNELPHTVLDLVQLESVICDEETTCLWENYEDSLKNLRVSIVKDEMNLNWLHKYSMQR